MILPSLNAQHVKWSLTLGLLVALAWLLGKLLWSITYSEVIYLQQPIIKSSKHLPSEVQNNANLYLFGKLSSPQTQSISKPVNEIKTSKLNLRLLGVMITPSISVAIIDKSGKSNSFALGEEVQKGVILEEVYPQYVIVNNRGLFERLEMSQVENVFSAEPGKEILLTPEETKKLVQVKAQALENPVSIMRYVRFQNVMSNGKINAIKLWPRQEKQIFSALGFQAGDQLESIGGRSIDTLSKSPDLWQKLLKQNQFELMIKRNGQQIPLLIEL